MQYLNSLISKWMLASSPRVAVDSHPRLSGIMDTVNSTLAHGPNTRLPSAFYDPKGRDIIDRIGVEEWFSGYKESAEYRTVGIGPLVADIVTRMVGSVQENGSGDGVLEIAGVEGDMGMGRGGKQGIRFAMSGCHDTTLAATLSSLGVFEDEKWPPYTSHVAFELFQNESVATARQSSPQASGGETKAPRQSFLGGSRKTVKTKGQEQNLTRKPLEGMSQEERDQLEGYYVRVRYNDRPLIVPGCKVPGKHLDGDESFCTLASLSISRKLFRDS